MLDKEKLDQFRSEYDYLSDKISKKLFGNSKISHFEIIGSAYNSIEISYEKGCIKYSEEYFAKGIGLRIIGTKGKEGTTYTSDFSENAINKTIENAMKMMKVSTENPDFINVAEPSEKYADIGGIYDPNIEKITLDGINELFLPIFSLKKEDKYLKGLSGEFSAIIGDFYINNSNGIEAFERASQASLSADVTLEKSGVLANGFHWINACQLNGISGEEIANKSYSIAKRSLKKTSIDTGKYPIILAPTAVEQLIVGPLVSAINAESIQNNRSFLVDKMNKSIANENFNLHEEPHIYGQLGTTKFDGEGVATKPMTILKKGVLKNIMHNTFTAGKANTENNAHASRGGYNSNLGIGNHNIIMDNGEKSKDELIGDVKSGIYFEYTGDHPNMITGDFSGLIMVGFLITDGEIGSCLTETLIGINLLDAYKQITEISKERIWVDEMNLPWIKLDDISISSGT